MVFIIFVLTHIQCHRLDTSRLPKPIDELLSRSFRVEHSVPATIHSEIAVCFFGPSVKSLVYYAFGKCACLSSIREQNQHWAKFESFRGLPGCPYQLMHVHTAAELDGRALEKVGEQRGAQNLAEKVHSPPVTMKLAYCLVCRSAKQFSW